MTYAEFIEVWGSMADDLYDPPINSAYAARQAVSCGNYADDVTPEHIEALEVFAATYVPPTGYNRNSIEYMYCDCCEIIVNNYNGHLHCDICSNAEENLNNCDCCDKCCNNDHNHCPGCDQKVDSFCEDCYNGSDCSCCECSHCNDCGNLSSCENCNNCEDCCDCNTKINYGAPWLANSPKDRKEFNNSRLIGVEWEYNSADKGEAPIVSWAKRWRSGIHDDGSCGREAVTAPISGDYISKCLTELSKAFTMSDVESDNRCGIHVHVDASDLSWNDMQKLLQVYARVEPLLYLIGGQHRVNSTYCAPCGNAYGEAVSSNSLKSMLKNNLSSSKNFQKKNLNSIKTKVLETAYNSDNPKDCLKYHKEALKKQDGRYRGLNIIPWLVGRSKKSKDTTVEFRIHKNTLDVNRVINWSKLLVSIVDWCAKASSKDIENLSHSDLQALCSIAPGSKKFILSRIKEWRTATAFEKYNAVPRRISFNSDRKTCIVHKRSHSEE